MSAPIYILAINRASGSTPTAYWFFDRGHLLKKLAELVIGEDHDDYDNAIAEVDAGNFDKALEWIKEHTDAVGHGHQIYQTPTGPREGTMNNQHPVSWALGLILVYVALFWMPAGVLWVLQLADPLELLVIWFLGADVLAVLAVWVPGLLVDVEVRWYPRRCRGSVWVVGDTYSASFAWDPFTWQLGIGIPVHGTGCQLTAGPFTAAVVRNLCWREEIGTP